MKRIIYLLSSLLLSVCGLKAQSEMDIYKFFQTDISGTARYMGMAGAFGALGGDASAIKDNPAALGVFRSSELSGSLNTLWQSGSSVWNKTRTTYEDPIHLASTNINLILSNKKWGLSEGESGILYSNWSFGYNRLKNFERSFFARSGLTSNSLSDYLANFSKGISEADLQAANSFSNTNIPWVSVLAYNAYLINPGVNDGDWISMLMPNEQVTPTYYTKESGYVDQYSLSWGMNLDHKYYFGVSGNLQTINYNSSSTYAESFGSSESFTVQSDMSSRGSGLNLSIGAIARPVDFLRLGLSFRTPTFYKMTDRYWATMLSTLRINNALSTSESYTPDDGYNYFKIQGPIQVNASAAFVFSKRGVISGEYNFTNMPATRLMTDKGSLVAYRAENERMGKMFNNAHTFKVGAEYKLDETVSFRGGYAYSQAMNKSGAEKIPFVNTIRSDNETFIDLGQQYLTAGIGFRGASWFLDFAYVRRVTKENFIPYNLSLFGVENELVTSKTTANNIAVTLGLKF